MVKTSFRLEAVAYRDTATGIDRDLIGHEVFAGSYVDFADSVTFGEVLPTHCQAQACTRANLRFARIFTEDLGRYGLI